MCSVKIVDTITSPGSKVPSLPLPSSATQEEVDDDEEQSEMGSGLGEDSNTKSDDEEIVSVLLHMIMLLRQHLER